MYSSRMQAFDKLRVVGTLSAVGTDVNRRDADPRKPLLNAIFKRHDRSARGLIELGAHVSAANLSSEDAVIHFVVSFDHHKILPLLLVHGADYIARICGG